MSEMAIPLTWAEFDRVEIRVGTIIGAVDFLKAKKPAYQLTIDFGENIGIRRSSAQIVKLYDKEILIGKQIVAVVNFPEKQIANFFSQCLVLGSVAADGTVTLLHPERTVENGLRIG
jgi:tRNA-binding protein